MSNTATVTNETLSESLRGKAVVADTSSLLVSGLSLFSHIEDCLLVIPAIVVKELESKRTSPGSLGYTAREWLRFIEKLRVEHDTALSTGVEYTNGITIRVQPNHSSQTSLPGHLQDGSHDSTILAVAKNLVDDVNANLEHSSVAILSNDVPMRLHATLDLGLEAYEFSTTLVEGAKPFDGVVRVTMSESDYARSPLVTGHQEYRLSDLPEFSEASDSHAALVVVSSPVGERYGTWLKVGDLVTRCPEKGTVANIRARSVEQATALSYLGDPELTVVSLSGSAGTGKTLLAVAAGIKSGKKLQVLRSLHEMGRGQELGFLPGTVDDKMAPWSDSFKDALDVIGESSQSSDFTVSPITYLRGRSLKDTYVILEEAQNFSKSEILNVLSRLGEGSKLVLTFDPDQVDNRFLQSGSKAEVWSVIDRMKSEDLFAHITLTKTERSRTAELASRILSE